MNIFICDFNDSFTYNIYSELKILFPHEAIEVIKFDRVLSFLQIMASQRDNKALIVLGPGPGHPLEYKSLCPSLKLLLENNSTYILGVCLGHQLIWHMMGYEVSHAVNARHGVNQKYLLDASTSELFLLPRSITVQKYNSLTVKLNKNDCNALEKKGFCLYLDSDELVMSRHKRLLTYQFHPESIGTTCPQLFFKPLLNFLL